MTQIQAKRFLNDSVPQSKIPLFQHSIIPVFHYSITPIFQWLRLVDDSGKKRAILIDLLYKFLLWLGIALFRIFVSLGRR
jgi:hypothetical protein